MEFELTHEILDQIIFAMEDQTQEFVVDSRSGEVLPRQGADEERREPEYVSLPSWRPVDGYQLMERFVTALRNPIVREELRTALSAGKGVFRSFKDTLRRSAEIEKRWYVFKERAMRRVVYEWYNQMREVAGLEKLALEQLEDMGETDELLATDFVIAEGPGNHARSLPELDRSAFDEMLQALEPERRDELYSRRAARYPPLLHGDSLVMVAEDQGGELAGMVWAVERPAGPLVRPLTWRIVQLTVVPAYRGLGLARALLRRLLATLYERGASGVLVDLATGSLPLADLFARRGFETVSQLMSLDLDRWEAE